MQLKKIFSWFKKHPDIQSWVKKHSSLVEKIRHRFDPRIFSGFPLTILCVAAVLCLWGLFDISLEVVHPAMLTAIDLRLENLLFAFRDAKDVWFFSQVTNFSGPASVGIGLAVVALVCVFKKHWRAGAIILSGYIGAEFIVFIGKMLFHRDRPDVSLHAVLETSYSYPSGHAASIAFAIGFLVYLFFATPKRRVWMMAISTLLGVMAIVLVDLSRLYLGVHYLSDVLAGNLVGFFVLTFTIFFLQKTKTQLGLLFIPICLFIMIVSGFFLGIINKSYQSLIVEKSPIAVISSELVSLFDGQKLPRFSETLSGRPMEPLSFLLVVPPSCMTQDFSKAGWNLAENLNSRSLWTLAKAALFNTQDVSAPMTPSFFDAKPHYLGFEKATAKGTVRSRHHARFWQTDYTTPEGRLFVGTASLDTGLKWGITHTIAPDIDTERDVLISDLEKTGLLANKTILPHFVSPILGKNFTGDYYFTDGGAALIQMKCP